MLEKIFEFSYAIFFKFVNLFVWLGLVILYPFEVGYKLIRYGMTEAKTFRKKLRKKQLRTKQYVVALRKALDAVRSFIRRVLRQTEKLISGLKIFIYNRFGKKKRGRKKKIKIFTRINLFVFGVFATVLFVLIPMRAYDWFKSLPQPVLLAQIQNKSTKILDRKGRLLYEIYIDRKYDPVPLSKIPKSAINATFAIEDSSFYNHIGIQPVSMMRAAKAILIDDQLQGGSTITQQLVKNVLLSNERTLTRKLKEIFLSILVERQYTKDEILELYLNNIAYGGTAWGIQSASQKYFGKDVSDLTLPESSFLAGLPSAPSVYSPFINGGNGQKFKERQKVVLDRMVELKYITSDEALFAYAEELNFVPQAEYIRAPHFVDFVKNELYRRYGKRFVDFGGLTVTTSLDLDLHEKVQDIVATEVANGAYLNYSNGAAVVLDARSGEILAYVGSVDYFSDGSGKYDVLMALRQPGSSIKPVTYVLAFSGGYTPASTIEDAPFTISSYGQVYTPVNYDGKYHGIVTLRQALANSYNIPAVKLVRNLGVERMITLAAKMGIKNWKFDNTFGYSVTLGGKEVRLIDLTNVYTTLARGGVYKEVTPFVSVKDMYGFEILGDKRKEERVLDEGAAYLVSHILSDNYARAQAFGLGSSLVVPGHTVAVKTGTSDEKRDNLTLGYTPSYVVGVWVGNNDNSPMNPYLASGLSGAAPIWNRIMTVVLAGSQNEEFERPGNIFVKIDEECGGRSEVFVKGTAPKHLCDRGKGVKKT